MKGLYHSCQGESHIVANKVCQDASYCYSDEHMSIAIVCDGHGGEIYVRSDIGATTAIDVTKECVESFIRQVDKQMLVGKPFSQRFAITSEAKDAIITKEYVIDKALRQLFSSIIYNWRNRIQTHAASTPLTDEEKALLPSDFQEKFERNEDIAKAYGCTLICFVCTEDFWIAFHIGDGKCIAFDENGAWSEPIPWDERCFLNKTTSICDANAIDEFRYCYCGDGNFPLAIFLGSDGMDDSFGLDENMVNFYIQVLKLIVNEGEESAYNTIVETLPQLSKVGSKDDMSLVCVYNDNILANCLKSLVTWQLKNVEASISSINDRIIRLSGKIDTLANTGMTTQKNVIDYQYAQKDIAKLFDQKQQLAERWNKFAQELYGEGYEPYSDGLGMGKAEEEIESHCNSDEGGN